MCGGGVSGRGKVVQGVRREGEGVVLLKVTLCRSSCYGGVALSSVRL